MKKIFAIIAVIMMAVAAISCGTATKVQSKTIDAYTGIGVGKSMDESIARDIAYTNAVANATDKINQNVTKGAERHYLSKRTEDNKFNETIGYNSVVVTKAEAKLTDIVVNKETVAMEDDKYVCTMVVSVARENVKR